MKTLLQVVEQVESELQISRGQLSLKIGKSRNYLSEAIRKGLKKEREDKLIQVLYDLVDDEFGMLRKANDNLNLLSNGLYSENMQLNEELDNLQAIILEKNEHIKIQDGIINNVREKNKKLEEYLDEACGYADKTQILLEESMRESLSKDKTIEALAKAGHATGYTLNKAKRKVRVLTGITIALTTILAVTLWVR